MPVYQAYTPSLGEAIVNGVRVGFQAHRQKQLDDLDAQLLQSQLTDAFTRRVTSGYRPGAPPTTDVDTPTFTPDDLNRAFSASPDTLGQNFNARLDSDRGGPPPQTPGGAFQANLTNDLQRSLRGAPPGSDAAPPPPAQSTAQSSAQSPTRGELLMAKSQDFHQRQGARSQARDALGPVFDPSGQFVAQVADALLQQRKAASTQQAPSGLVTPSGTMPMPTTDARYVPVPDKTGGGYIDTQAPLDRQMYATALRQQLMGERQMAVNAARPRYQVRADKDGNNYVVDLNNPNAGAEPVEMPTGDPLVSRVPQDRTPAAPPRRTGSDGVVYERDPVSGEWQAATTADGSPLRAPQPAPRAVGPNSNGAVSAAAATGRAISQNNATVSSLTRSLPKFPTLSVNPQADSASVISARTPILQSLGNAQVRGDSLQRAHDQEATAIGTRQPVNGAVDMTDVRGQVERANQQLDAVMRSTAPQAVKARAQDAYRARVQRLTSGGPQ